MKPLNKKAIFTIVAGALALGLVAGEALADRMRASGKISNSCAPDPGAFTVPGGKTASNFRVEGLNAGRTCTTGQPIQQKGFGIQNANRQTVFRYNGPASLNGLALAPGTYWLYVDGGIGAAVTVSFDVQ